MPGRSGPIARPSFFGGAGGLSCSFCRFTPGPGRLPGPDIILLIALSWIVMRPDYVPVLLLAVVFLLTDLLLMRPPGLWTALAVLAGEFLRNRQLQLRARRSSPNGR